MIPSPCTGVCTVDPETGWCAGCARTRDEIAGWGSRAPEERAAIWSALPERLDRLGVALRRADWDEAAIRAAVLERLRGGGRWAVGLCAAGAGAETRDAAAQAEGDVILARGPGVALRLRIDRHVRALRQRAEAGRPEALVLAVPRMRLPDDEPAEGLTEIGPDRKALAPEDREAVLFDLGFGAEAGRVMLRTADTALLALLRRHLGADPAALLAEAGAAIEAAAPTRVVDSFRARLEIRPPAPEAARPLSQALAALAETPPWIDLDDSLAPVAIHFADAARAAA